MFGCPRLLVELANDFIQPNSFISLERWQWVTVLVCSVRLQQSHEVAFAGKPRHAASNQWRQFVTDAPSQNKRRLFALGKFERQFVRSVVGENGMRVEL